MKPARFSPPLPEPWQSTVTWQVFHAYGRWRKGEVDLIDWRTNCRVCGEDHLFTLRADYNGRIGAQVSIRWHGICRWCRKAGAS